MPVIENTMKTKLEAGKAAYSFNISSSRSVATPGIAKACGFDWLFIDAEHSAMDLDTISAICIAALPLGITPIVRVTGHESFHATRVLDGGAMGVIVPHVNTPEQAEQVVRNCKFPPMGERSMTAPAPQLGFEAMPAAEAITALNETTFVVVMVETPEAVENVDAIAAVPGVDAVLIGSNDLSATMGIPGQLDHERMVDAFEKVISACNDHGKHPGMGGVYDPPLMERYIKLGARFCQGGGDTALMISAGKERMAFLNSLS